MAHKWLLYVVGPSGRDTQKSVSCLLFVAAVGSYAAAWAAPPGPQPCPPGHILTPHTPPGFNFATTSWKRTGSPGNVAIYWACVENHDPQKALYIYWHIPGLEGYMGRADSGVADSLVGPRVFTVHDTADVLGCLVYGNHRLTKKVEFMSHRNDLARASAEGDCSGLRPAALGGRRGASSAQKGPSPSFLVGGRISVPSNGEDVEGTLIRFVYQIGLIPDGPDYRMLLAYQAAPVSPEFHGDIRRLTVRPSLAAVRESLMRIGYGDGIIQLADYEGGFTIPMKLPEQYIIEEQQYGFYDAKGNPVGAIYAPFLSPEAPR